MSVSRVVALLTPVFAALSGYVATQALKLPGAPVLDADQLTLVFVAGAGAAGVAAVKWLDGRAQHERQRAEIAAEESWMEPEPEVTIEDAKKVLGLTGLEADVARALGGLRGLDSRLDAIENSRVPGSTSRAAHHPV